MLPNELARVQPAARICSITWADKRRDEFAHFEMQMRQIASVGISDGGDFVAAPHYLLRPNEYLRKVRVVGLHLFSRALFFDRVQDNDDLAPTRPAFPREDDAAICDRVNRVAIVAVLAANAIQVITEMTIFGERLRVVGEGAVLAAERKIETRSRR